MKNSDFSSRHTAGYPPGFQCGARTFWSALCTVAREADAIPVSPHRAGFLLTNQTSQSIMPGHDSSAGDGRYRHWSAAGGRTRAAAPGGSHLTFASEPLDAPRRIKSGKGRGSYDRFPALLLDKKTATKGGCIKSFALIGAGQKGRPSPVGDAIPPTSCSHEAHSSNKSGSRNRPSADR
jgi:hypothetical protein